jgi:hypothetical protein
LVVSSHHSSVSPGTSESLLFHRAALLQIRRRIVDNVATVPIA